MRLWGGQTSSTTVWSWTLASFFIFTLTIDLRHSPVEHSSAQSADAWTSYFRVYDVLRGWSTVVKALLGVGLLIAVSRRLAAIGATAFGTLGMLDVAVRAIGGAPRRACGCLGHIDIEPGPRALMLVGVIGLALLVASGRDTCRAPARGAEGLEG
jgi:hypothetical protein